jgi:tetratricopeptide (TPR) repeat protein
MKKQYLFIIFSVQFFLINASFPQNQNLLEEEEAIKQVIMNETKSWEKRDYKGMADAWLHEKHVLLVYSSPYSYGEHIGWDSVDANIKENIGEYTEPFKYNFEWSDWDIRIFDNGAFVTYIQTMKMSDGNSYISREVRFLEKKKGLWKFTYLNALQKTVYEEYLKNEAENQINAAGYTLLYNNKIIEAIEVFKLNVKLYPESSNVYDSLGEAYMKNGDTELAIENYKKSLELDPKNKNAEDMLVKLSVK